jgi:hypothetical protein
MTLRCCIADHFAIVTRIVAKLNSYWISNVPAISVHPAEQSIARATTPIATTDCSLQYQLCRTAKAAFGTDRGSTAATRSLM